jgi:hypothetical protein
MRQLLQWGSLPLSLQTGAEYDVRCQQLVDGRDAGRIADASLKEYERRKKWQ